MPVGIIIVENPDARQAQVNRYGGLSLGSVENKTVMSQIRLPLRLFVNDHEMPAEEQPLQRAIRTGETVRDVDARLLRSDDSSLHMLISAMPLFDEQERPRGATAAIVDFTQRERVCRREDRSFQHPRESKLTTYGPPVAVRSAARRGSCWTSPRRPSAVGG